VTLLGQPAGRLDLRLPARLRSAALVRVELRWWLTSAGASEDEVFEIVLAADKAFVNTIEHPCEPRSITIDVKATCEDGVVEVVVHDYGVRREDPARTDDEFGMLLLSEFMGLVETVSGERGTTVVLRRRLGSSHRVVSGSPARPGASVRPGGRSLVFRPM
jgi:anti-sigma regulatory factor (Ser/Thr protein kinase)